MLTKNSIVSTLLSFTIVVGTSMAYGQNASDYPLTPIHFPAGKSSATISDGVERGASATYSFGAEAGKKPRSCSVRWRTTAFSRSTCRAPPPRQATAASMCKAQQ